MPPDAGSAVGHAFHKTAISSGSRNRLARLVAGRLARALDRIVIEIPALDGPTQHRPEISERLPRGGTFAATDLRINHAMNVAAMKLAEPDRPDDRNNIGAKSAPQVPAPVLIVGQWLLM